jgi:hypothetical protein
VLSREHPVSGTRPSTVGALVVAISAVVTFGASTFDHFYQSYGALLTPVVRDARVDYRVLVSRKRDLELVAREFGSPSEQAERGWTRQERIAFWINAYNVFTLKAIADRYPVRSIRQIRGVWTDLRFRGASREVTLDDIEHRILRPEFKDARVHFAINCASVSCPPLREEPYVAARLDAQLDEAARRYLASPLGLQMRGRTLHVSSIFKWYGDDFMPSGIPGTIATYGPPAAQQIARSPDVRLRFLRYDWSLNDTAR